LKTILKLSRHNGKLELPGTEPVARVLGNGVQPITNLNDYGTFERIKDKRRLNPAELLLEENGQKKRAPLSQ